MTTPIVIVFAYRNRETTRISKSLQSLATQTNANFRVVFVDYGSEVDFATSAKQVVSEYSFVEYHYLPYQKQPWNKSRALNFVIKYLSEDYFLVADVDMIFHPEMVARMHDLKHPEKITFFKVGYLSEAESIVNKDFESYTVNFISTSAAKGITLFSTDLVKKISGFDEFFHFWGAEDVDIHFRLVKSGYQSVWYQEELLLLHLWHPSYMVREKPTLTRELQVTNIIRINHEHLKFNLNQSPIRYHKDWGKCYSMMDFMELEKVDSIVIIGTEKEIVDHFLYGFLPSYSNTILSIQFKNTNTSNPLRDFVKKILKKKVVKHYTLKEVNDKVLLHLISFYRNNLYTVEVTENLTAIEVKIKLD